MKEILFQLDPALPASLQSQLREKIVNAILSRALQPGERLPSSRSLSKQLNIARNTVTLSYQALVDAGYLTPKPRSGYVVNAEAPAYPPRLAPDLVNANPELTKIDWNRRFLYSGDELRFVHKPLNWRDYTYPFSYGQADFDLFSHSEWRDCARQALGARDFGALAGDFSYHDDPLLVEYIASHSLPQRGIYMQPENILVTLGAQNALYLIAELLVSQQTTVVLEEPCYPDLRNILARRTSRINHLPVDAQGLVPDEKILRNCDFLFITPSHQCPTTATMPTQRRKHLLELAEIHDFIIVEDDYEFEMNFLASPLPALKTLDRHERVIYVGSFSKSLFPGLRLGYLGAPVEFIAKARNLRHLMFRHPPGHSQRTAAYFMALGHYSAQMRKLRKTYALRREITTQALRQHGIDNTTAAHFGGTSFWIEGPQNLDCDRLSDALVERRVLIEPGTPFFAANIAPTRYFRIAYSSIHEDKIANGIKIIAQTINELAG